MGNKRIEWIDVARGIGICLMSFGHLFDRSGQSPWFPALGPLLSAIYLFHMPLFFVLAGCTFSGRRSFAAFARRKVQTLLVPYIVFSPYYLARPLAASLWPAVAAAFDADSSITLAEGLFDVFVMGEGLWFLMALFIAELAAWGFSHVFGGHIGVWAAAGVALAACYYILPEACADFVGLPFQLARAVEACGYLCLGVALREWLCSLGRRRAACLAVVALAGFCLLANPLVTARPAASAWWAAYLAAAMLGTFAVIGSSIALARSRLLGWIGRESVMFYAVQALCINLAKLILFSGLALDFSGAPFAVQLAGGLACTALAMAMMALCDIAVRRWLPWAIGAPRRRVGA